VFLENTHWRPPIRLFVATALEQIPGDVTRFVSVDGTVPGCALAWDHHVTGEPTNLDCMPAAIDLGGFDGLATTMADTDAVASAVVALLGGRDAVPPHLYAVFVSASHWCDHLRAYPEHTEDTSRLGRGLLDHVATLLAAAAPAQKSATFEAICRGLEADVRAGRPLPFRDGFAVHRARAADLVREGRIYAVGPVGVLDLRDVPSIDPAAAYERVAERVALFVYRHNDGRLRYTVGVNPNGPSPLPDLIPALDALATAEFSHGPPALAPSRRPGSENWGGRAAAGGSPWNYGSRLAIDEVAEIVTKALGLAEAPPE
jgi:hypothetical protein